MPGFLSTALVAGGLIASAAAAITNPVDPIVIKGSKFFYKTNGTQFFMRGVAYQAEYTGGNTDSTTTSKNYVDPLSDVSICQRDIPYLKQLRTNIIRTYAIDPTVNHDACMQLLNDAGIYVISDLSQPDVSINRNTPVWNEALLDRYTAVVDSLAPYNNVLGFFAGNEVSNQPNNTQASAFVRAAIRDTKAYIKSKNYRTIGVGYATNDDADIRVNMADYFNCGDQTSAIDFWGYNVYSWCGDSTYATSGYQDRTNELANYSVPAFFAEYGCNEVTPRTFSEVNALYGSQMTPVWSGGIVYMYYQEANNYGLVTISNSKVSTLTDFSNLSSRLATISPTGVNAASYTTSNSAAACPATTLSAWKAPASPLPPTPNSNLCTCMVNSLECNVAASVSTSDYSKLFNQVCGYSGSPCAGINTNSSAGAYGAYGMCTPQQQLGYAFNAYYQIQKKSAAACSFGGSATTKAAASTTGSCSTLLAQAGASGTGVVDSSVTGSGSSSSSSSTSSGAAVGSLNVHHVSFGGFVSMAAYVAVAMVSGAAMLLL